MELCFRDMTQKSICSDHTGGGLLTFMRGMKFYDSHTNWTLVSGRRDLMGGEILNQDTSVVWTFYQVLNTVRLKCGGIIKNGWMIDPLNLATKHDEYLAPSWRKPWVLLDLDMIARTILTGGWAHLDAILCHLWSSLHLRCHKVP